MSRKITMEEQLKTSVVERDTSEKKEYLNYELDLAPLNLDTWKARSTDFLWKSLQKFEQMLKEINEYGPQSVAEQTANLKKKKIKATTKNLIDYFMIYKRFLEKFHQCSNMLIACL